MVARVGRCLWLLSGGSYTSPARPPTAAFATHHTMSSAAARAEARRKAILARGGDRLAKLTSSARGEDASTYLHDGTYNIAGSVASPCLMSLRYRRPASGTATN